MREDSFRIFRFIGVSYVFIPDGPGLPSRFPRLCNNLSDSLLLAKEEKDILIVSPVATFPVHLAVHTSIIPLHHPAVYPSIVPHQHPSVPFIRHFVAPSFLPFRHHSSPSSFHPPRRSFLPSFRPSIIPSFRSSFHPSVLPPFRRFFPPFIRHSSNFSNRRQKKGRCRCLSGRLARARPFSNRADANQSLL